MEWFASTGWLELLKYLHNMGIINRKAFDIIGVNAARCGQISVVRFYRKNTYRTNVLLSFDAITNNDFKFFVKVLKMDPNKNKICQDMFLDVFCTAAAHGNLRIMCFAVIHMRKISRFEYWASHGFNSAVQHDQTKAMKLIRSWGFLYTGYEHWATECHSRKALRLLQKWNRMKSNRSHSFE